MGHSLSEGRFSISYIEDEARRPEYLPSPQDDPVVNPNGFADQESLSRLSCYALASSRNIEVSPEENVSTVDRFGKEEDLSADLHSSATVWMSEGQQIIFQTRL